MCFASRERPEFLDCMTGEGSLDAPTREIIKWQDPDFADPAKLDAEMRRVFDICHGCRRCFNLCDSFPAPVRPDRHQPAGRCRASEIRRLQAGRGSLHALRHVLHDQMPLCAAASLHAGFPASDAAPPLCRSQDRATQQGIRAAAAGRDGPQRHPGAAAWRRWSTGPATRTTS